MSKSEKISKVRIGDTAKAIKESDLPDRLFREAWQFSKSKISINMEKARILHIERLRAEREDLFKSLDIEITKALVSGDLEAAAQVESKRQELRDVTSDIRIQSAATPEKLSSLTLSTLIDL